MIGIIIIGVIIISVIIWINYKNNARNNNLENLSDYDEMRTFLDNHTIRLLPGRDLVGINHKLTKNHKKKDSKLK